MIVGLVCAFLSAVCYGTASVLQAIAARRTPAASGLDVRLITRLMTQLPYLAGLGLDGAGFVASIVALRSLPLFLVESAVASSVGVTALLAIRVFRTPLSRREIVSLLVLGGGLVLLAVSAHPEAGRPLQGAARWWLLACAAGVAVVGAAGSRVRPAYGGALLAVGAGLGFAGVGIAARVIVVPQPWWHVLGSPVLWAIVAYGGLAMLMFGTALQRAAVTVVTAVTFAVETVVPAAIGLAWLGDAPRRGFAAVAAVGFALALGGAVALALSGAGERVAGPVPESVTEPVTEP